ncbi:MAG: hypothetical protein ACD_7C00556G0002 [uncultured bacterium]|nr:MAG: hypothetical protein ACD_7C00556G0002 [uncultured bacterium]
MDVNVGKLQNKKTAYSSRFLYVGWRYEAKLEFIWLAILIKKRILISSLELSSVYTLRRNTDFNTLLNLN